MPSSTNTKLISLQQEMCLVEEIQLGLSDTEGYAVQMAMPRLRRSRFNSKFSESSLFSVYEQEYCQNKPTPAVSFSGLWCAKQAFMKAAISLGFTNFNYLSLEVRHRSTGQPIIVLHSNLANQFREQNINVEVTIAHTKTIAVAAVLFWGDIVSIE
jgi:phosphopantetheine--protein transferase-like protein